MNTKNDIKNDDVNKLKEYKMYELSFIAAGVFIAINVLVSKSLFDITT
jgi:hypothetical protein